MTYNNPVGASFSGSRQSTTWMRHKEQAKQSFQSGDYQQALSSYRAALQLGPSAQEKQLLLSNIVACRLRIGGPEQIQTAVEEATQCVAVNPSWSKGHVRLASAYIALGGHSNEACNSLQTALRLDPGNREAREMLVRELRRDHAELYTARESTASLEDDERDPPYNPNYTGRSSSGVDDQLSWSDRFRFTVTRTQTWYTHQSETVQILIKVCIGFLVLYVAFGGRFGLENYSFNSSNNSRQCSWWSDPAQCAANGNASRQQRQLSGNSFFDFLSYSTSRRKSRNKSWWSSWSSSSSRWASSSSSSSGSIFDAFGGFQNFVLLAVILLACKQFGINVPFHALMMFNLMNRRRHRGGGMYYGRGGGGMYGRPPRRW